MNNQLNNISTQYRKFSKGQYVEHTQFNEFLDFFEDQDRLSRVMLQGVGVVCGLKHHLIYKGSLLKSIELSQGVAITTDGDLLTLNKTSEVTKDLYVSDLKSIKIDQNSYTHFKEYDNFKVKYPSFYDAEGKQQIELWELATNEESNSDFQSIGNLSNLEDKFLLLYLESYEKEVKPCRGVDCDNHGIQQIRNLKVLVTTAEGIRRILEEDHIQPHPLFLDDILGAEKQERVILERLILEKGTKTQFSPPDLKKLYSDVLEKNNYGETVFKKINAISQILGIPTVNHENFKKILEDCLLQSVGFQYAYDVVKDLAETYSEIIKLLPKAFTQCLPDLLSFPKHIMLGKLMSNTQLDFSRHQFYNSPVLDDEKTSRRVKVLINRFRLQAENFRYSEVENSGQIKITPSQKLNPLSNKAIPFYYQITDEFLKAWNFDKTGNRSSGNNLAYNTALLSSDVHVQNALGFNIDKNSFYNIEGHQGMQCQEAFEQIKKIKDDHQLGFDVMVLSLAELKDNKDMSKAFFNEYLEKHPGLEHVRGVKRGGTFVIVYEINGRDLKVVADFSLPYICCTPKIDVKLILPETVICEKSRMIPFTVYPQNGVVKAILDADLNGGVEIIGGQYFFNPTIVSPELRGQEITFSVNGIPTNCKIKVLPQPNVEVAVNSVSYPEAGASGTRVHFVVSGQNFTDYTYQWDFWNNGDLITLNPDSEGNVYYTFSELSSSEISAIKVKVSGSGCSQEIIIEDWYDEPEPAMVINNVSFPNGNCCEGVAPTITAETEGFKRLPVSEKIFTIKGSGSGADNLLYSWTKIAGPAVTLNGTNTPDLEVKDIVVGEYQFKFTVIDADSGAFADEVVGVNVFAG